MTPFGAALAARCAEVGACACVGLDPFLDRIPGAEAADPADAAAAVRTFCLDAVEAVAGVVPAVKPQSALFEQLGAPGLAVLAEVVRAAKDRGSIVVLDGKRGDIGSTAEAYARAQLDDLGPIGADAVTLSPYLGPESLAPFLRRTEVGKGLFVLVRTSNPGAGGWQAGTGFSDAVAAWIATQSPGPGLGPVGAVVAATLEASESRGLRQRMPHAWLLVPGFGAQGAGPDEVRPHFRADGLGALVTSSREVLFGRDGGDPRAGIRSRALDFAAAVRSAAGGRPRPAA